MSGLFKYAALMNPAYKTAACICWVIKVKKKDNISETIEGSKGIRGYWSNFPAYFLTQIFIPFPFLCLWFPVSGPVSHFPSTIGKFQFPVYPVWLLTTDKKPILTEWRHSTFRHTPRVCKHNITNNISCTRGQDTKTIHRKSDCSSNVQEIVQTDSSIGEKHWRNRAR